MPLALLFALGIANFAIHKAVLDSGHPMLDALPRFYRASAGRASLVFEFLVLLAAMLLAGNGWTGAVWAYLVYSALNARGLAGSVGTNVSPLGNARGPSALCWHDGR